MAAGAFGDKIFLGLIRKERGRERVCNHRRQSASSGLRSRCPQRASAGSLRQPLDGNTPDSLQAPSCGGRPVKGPERRKYPASSRCVEGSALLMKSGVKGHKAQCWLSTVERRQSRNQPRSNVSTPPPQPSTHLLQCADFDQEAYLGKSRSANFLFPVMSVYRTRRAPAEKVCL